MILVHPSIFKYVSVTKSLYLVSTVSKVGGNHSWCAVSAADEPADVLNGMKPIQPSLICWQDKLLPLSKGGLESMKRGKREVYKKCI